MMKEKSVVLIVFIFALIHLDQSIASSLDGVTFESLFERIDSFLPDHEKEGINDTIGQRLISAVSYSPDYVPTTSRIGKISSSDGLVHIYTWNYQEQSMGYKYGGIIHYQNADKKWDVVKLEDERNTMPKTGFVRTNQWYGALYYDIIVTRYKRRSYYTLLGWDGGDGIIAKKVIDNFAIEKRGEVKLGYPLFRIDGSVRSRILFQFNARGSMMLAYDKGYKKIVFDHLSPDSPGHKGQHQYYGPDFTYDGLKFKKGKWWLERNIDVRNKELK